MDGVCLYAFSASVGLVIVLILRTSRVLRSERAAGVA